MNEEKDFTILLSLIALGIVVCGALITFFQGNEGFMQGFPLIIIGLIFFPLILKSNSEKISEFNENLEKVMFFITLIIIAVSFVSLYVMV